MSYKAIVDFLTVAQLNLNFAGAIGYLAGDIAIQAMSTIHVYEHRRWLGWYNSPGGFHVARKYGRLCISPFWDSIYPGPRVDPAAILSLEGDDGPRYQGLYSGTVLDKTGHVARLLVDYCKNEIPSQLVEGSRRITIPSSVAIVNLSSFSTALSNPFIPSPVISHKHSPRVAAVPIMTTIVSAIACWIFGDWICCIVILAGAITNGLFCLIMGTANLTYTYPNTARGVPSGDGILQDRSGIVILLGREVAVTAVTKSRLSLSLRAKEESNLLGTCSLLLTLNAFSQLVFLPQGTTFGQMSFLWSLITSWVYSIFLCSLDLEGAQRTILVKSILNNPDITKRVLPTWTTTVIYTLLVFHDHALSENSESIAHPELKRALDKLLVSLIPNETVVWNIFREWVTDCIGRHGDFEEHGWGLWEGRVQALSLDQSQLLRDLREDATTAQLTFLKRSTKEPTVSDDVIYDDSR